MIAQVIETLMDVIAIVTGQPHGPQPEHSTWRKYRRIRPMRLNPDSCLGR